MGRTACPSGLAPVALAAALVLLLTGCHAQLAVDIQVARDGSGQLGLALAADEELLAASADAGVDPLAHVADAGRALADEGWEVSEDDDPDGGRVVRLRVGFEDTEAFNALAAELADALAAPEVRPIEGLRLSVEDASVRLEGAVGLEPGPGVVEHGLEPSEAVALLEAHDAFALEITARLPGELVETTAAEPEMPLRWTAGPGEGVEILAEAELPPPWLPLLDAAGAAVVALLAVVVLAVALVWRVRLSRSRGRARWSR